MTTEERHYDVSEAGWEYISPEWIVGPLADALGGFDLDPASGAEPEPYADHRLTILDDPDGLNANWGDYGGDVYLNFPYGEEPNKDWADKVAEELDKGEIDTLTVLLPGSTSTNWYRDAYARADIKTEIHKRISFDVPPEIDDEDANGASFASVIHSFGNFPREYHNALEQFKKPGYGKVETTVWERRPSW